MSCVSFSIIIIIALSAIITTCNCNNNASASHSLKNCHVYKTSNCPENCRFEDLLCVFEAVDTSVLEGCLPIKSSVQVNEYQTVPDSQGWARCRSCLLKDRNFFIFQEDTTGSSDRIQLSWSYWGEFFHTFHNDQYVAYTLHPSQFDASSLTYFVGRPVYLLPMITIHAGHVLIDYLEQVYHSMMTSYGRIRTDALIVLDVAGADERAILQEKLSLYSDNDTFGKLLTIFSDLPLISFETFQQITNYIGEQTIFDDIHFGLDLAMSFFNRGFEYHPCIWERRDKKLDDLFNKFSNRYRMFQLFIKEQLIAKGLMSNSSSRSSSDTISNNGVKNNKRSVNVLYIQRNKNRKFLNLESFIDIVHSLNPNINSTISDFDIAPFSEQLELLASTDVLVASAGTAIHNMLFMKASAVVVVVMQPGWCKWSWMYVNQAALLNIRFILFCTENPELKVPLAQLQRLRLMEYSHQQQLQQQHYSLAVQSYSIDNTNTVVLGTNSFHWTRKFWKQGPINSKSQNISLNIDKLPASLAKMCQQIELGLNIDVISTTPICITDDMTRIPRGPSIRTIGLSSNRNANVINIFNNSFAKSLQEIFNEQNIISNSNSINKKRSIPFLETYVSSIELSTTNTNVDNNRLNFEDNSEITLKLMGDIVSRLSTASLSFAKVVESMPHLSICFNSIFTMEESDSICYEISSFNYYSNLLLRISSPVHHAHLWLQSAPSTKFGKLAGSDCYLMIDTRLGEDGGLFIHSQAVGQMLIIPDELYAAAESKKVCIPKQHYLSTSLSLQRFSTDLCNLLDFTTIECGWSTQLLTEAAYRSVLAAKWNLPSVQLLPNPSIPFVFLHIEKTAGTTLREIFVESATKLGLSYFIPCHAGLHCITMSVPHAEIPSNYTMSNISIIAGHFEWGVWNQFPAINLLHSLHSATEQHSGIASQELLSPISPPPCFIMGRHPVDRAISYYYQRCYQIEGCHGYHQRLNSVPAEHIRQFIISDRQGERRVKDDPAHPIYVLDEGMSDAACRAIGGFKKTTALVVGVDDIRIPDILTDKETDIALLNANKCVIGLQDRWGDTKRVIKYWFPWIDLEIGDSERRRMHLFNDKETRESLRPDIRLAIEEENRCDLLLHQQMVERFERQLEVINAKYT